MAESVGRRDLQIVQHCGGSFTFTHNSGGSPVDNTGGAAVAEVRDGYGGTLLKRWDSSAGSITLGGANGKYSFSWTAVDADAIYAGSKRPVWDFLITAAGGQPRKLLEGNVVRDPTVTEP